MERTRLDDHEAFDKGVRNPWDERNPLPRHYFVPIALDVAEIVLDKMGGDWVRWRKTPRRYKARLIATLRVLRMTKAAANYDELLRTEMTRKDA